MSSTETASSAKTTSRRAKAKNSVGKTSRRAKDKNGTQQTQTTPSVVKGDRRISLMQFCDEIMIYKSDRRGDDKTVNTYIEIEGYVAEFRHLPSNVDPGSDTGVIGDITLSYAYIAESGETQSGSIDVGSLTESGFTASKEAIAILGRQVDALKKQVDKTWNAATRLSAALSKAERKAAREQQLRSAALSESAF